MDYTGKVCKVTKGTYVGSEIEIEGLWINFYNKSWTEMARTNFACRDYAMRVIKDKLILDDKVWYGHIGMFGKLIHESELELIENPL